MADTITFRPDTATEHALGVLTADGSTRSAVVRQALLDAAERRERAEQLRRAVLSMPLGEPDGIDIADTLVDERSR